jgi:hypothetical protein
MPPARALASVLAVAGLALAAGTAHGRAAGSSCPSKAGSRCAIVYDTGQGWLLLDASDPKLQNVRVDLTADFMDATRKNFPLVNSGRCAGKVVWLEYLDDDPSDRDTPAGKIERILFRVAFRGTFDPIAGFRSNMTPKFPC